MILLSSCAQQYGYITPEIRAQFLNDLKAGSLTLKCRFHCDLSWLHNYPRMINLHNTRMWADLAELVMQIGLENGPSYYFLGKAADELGYYDAAIIYYEYSMTLYNDKTAQNHCQVGRKLQYCGDVDYNYELPLLIADAKIKRDSLKKPYSGFPTPDTTLDSSKRSKEKKPSPEIKAAQEKLLKLGYDPGTADGLMGKKTREAIRKFQTDHNLTVTGKLSEETLAKMKENDSKDEPLDVASPSSKATEQQEAATQSPPIEELSLPTEPTTPPPQTTPPQTATGKGKITESTNILSQPSIMGDSIGPAAQGVTVDILSKDEKFYKIKYQGKVGYIYSDFIKEM
jgi:peptidoglycan hydrolase-like protein with peptidoglycan-binding domain